MSNGRIDTTSNESRTTRRPWAVLSQALRRLLLFRASVPMALVLTDLAVFAVGVTAGRAWVVLAFTHMGLLTIGGYYRSRLSLFILDDVAGVTGRFATAALLAGAFAELIDMDGEGLAWSRLAIIGVALILGRALVYALVRAARTRQLVNHRTLIVGAGVIGEQLASTFQAHPEYGLRPVAFYDPAPLRSPPSLPVHDQRSSLVEVVALTDSRVVIVAFSTIPEIELVRTIRDSTRLHADIFYVPRLFDLHSLDARDIEDAWGVPLVRLRRDVVRSFNWRIKRVLDIAVAGLGLVVLSPVLLLVAALVRIRLGSPVLFRQQRVSIDKREFTITKFRTLPESGSNESDQEWSPSGRQTTRLGAFLRATSIDELPQLWNILVGDMSLVGPRPERPHFVTEFAERYDSYPERHRVPAGLTGLAQINGLRGDTSIDERARFDNAYVERWSLANDLKILLRTPLAALRWRGR